MITIEAKDLTQAKRKASLYFRDNYTVVQEFLFRDIKFSRVNKKCASGTFEFSKWR